MESVFYFIAQNNEWLFSGLGVALISLTISGILGRARKSSNTVRQNNITRGNLNIQMGRDVKINIGSNSDDKIIESLRSQNKTNKKNQTDS